MSDVTRILNAAAEGDSGAANELLPLVYEELRRLAAAKMASENPGQTLQPTALVHEAWLRLTGDANRKWNDRTHFFAAAAEAMRRILVENARRKRAQRHGGGQQPEVRAVDVLHDEEKGRAVGLEAVHLHHVGVVEPEGHAGLVDEHLPEVRVARDAAERDLLWKGRKNAFGAVGRLSPSYYVQDAVIPRTKLPETLRKINEIGKRYGFSIGNIFHAGDGNLHPIILFDQRDPEEFKRAVAASGEIMRHCIECGGALTGEHGIGMEKNELMPLMFSDADLELMRRVREAFNPEGRLNPGKVLPLGKGCKEVRIPPGGTASLGVL